MKKIKTICSFLFLILLLDGCSKNFLDLKPSKSQVVPSTSDDLWAIMNNTIKMNSYFPSLGELSSDNSYYLSNVWNKLSEIDSKNAYIWSKDILTEGQANDWSYMYVKVFNSNIVLETLEENKKDIEEREKKTLKGTALFFRSYAFFQLSQHFMEAYDEKNAQNKLGIPLRLSSDLNKRSVRSTMEETYDRIIVDLKESAELLATTATVKTLPCKAAALMVLAKVFLVKGDYKNALSYANAAIEASSAKLIDFKELSGNSGTPFTRYNQEVIFHNLLLGRASMSSTNLRMSPELLESYDEGDLRKEIYFKKEKDNLYSFKGSYDGSVNMFGGLALDELYLIAAECYARKSDLINAKRLLKVLLDKRYKNTFELPNTIMDQPAILDYILDHRRKELILRGTRWSDLKRLNRESSTAKTITRTIDTKQYVLEPNASRYVFPIPLQVIILSGMQQNE